MGLKVIALEVTKNFESGNKEQHDAKENQNLNGLEACGIYRSVWLDRLGLTILPTEYLQVINPRNHLIFIHIFP